MFLELGIWNSLCSVVFIVGSVDQILIYPEQRYKQESSAWKTHFPAIQVDLTCKLSESITKSASESKLSVPFCASMPSACAGWSEAASSASTTEQAEIETNNVLNCQFVTYCDYANNL